MHTEDCPAAGSMNATCSCGEDEAPAGELSERVWDGLWLVGYTKAMVDRGTISRADALKHMSFGVDFAEGPDQTVISPPPDAYFAVDESEEQHRHTPMWYHKYRGRGTWQVVDAAGIYIGVSTDRWELHRAFGDTTLRLFGTLIATRPLFDLGSPPELFVLQSLRWRLQDCSVVCGATSTLDLLRHTDMVFQVGRLIELGVDTD